MSPKHYITLATELKKSIIGFFRYIFWRSIGELHPITVLPSLLVRPIVPFFIVDDLILVDTIYVQGVNTVSTI